MDRKRDEIARFLQDHIAGKAEGIVTDEGQHRSDAIFSNQAQGLLNW
jgi:hypothetical protein